MLKPSRRAVVIAASFALGLSCVGPYAQAGLLGGDEGGLPLVGGLLGGEEGGLPLVGGLLGGEGGLPLVGGLLGGEGGLPLVGGLLGNAETGGPLSLLQGGLLADASGLLALEPVLDIVNVVVPDADALLPGAGTLLEILNAFSETGSIVPGLSLETLGGLGVLGALGSL